MSKTSLKLTIAALCMYSLGAFAQTPSNEAHQNINSMMETATDYARCSVQTEHFPDDQVWAVEMNLLLAMSKLLNEVFELTKPLNTSPGSQLLQQHFGKDTMIGMKIVEMQEMTKTRDQKKQIGQLLEQYKYDVERVSEVLWKQYGCNTIYSLIPKPFT